MSTSPIVNQVREYRLRRAGMRQEDLARLCGVTRQTIIALETGRYSPSLELAFRLAHALGARIDDVFQLQGPKTKNG